MKNLFFYLFSVLVKAINFVVDLFTGLFSPIVWKPILSLCGNVVSFITGKYVFDKQPCSATGGTA